VSIIREHHQVDFPSHVTQRRRPVLSSNGFIWRLDAASLLRLINAAISMGAPRFTMDPVVPAAAMEGEVLGLRADNPRSGYLGSLSRI
jgi:hypothetical protein